MLTNSAPFVNTFKNKSFFFRPDIIISLRESLPFGAFGKDFYEKSQVFHSLRGLFAVGDVRNSPFRQVVTACADGAVAAHYAGMLVDELKGEAYI